jgi:hypothetical protein
MKWRLLLGAAYVAAMALPFYLAEADGFGSDCLAGVDTGEPLLSLWYVGLPVFVALAVRRWWAVAFPLVGFLLVLPIQDRICSDGTISDYYGWWFRLPYEWDIFPFGWGYFLTNLLPFAVVAAAGGVVWFIKDVRRLRRGERSRIPLPRL